MGRGETVGFGVDEGPLGGPGTARIVTGRQQPSFDRLEATLEARLPTILAEVGGLLEADWPDYAQFLDRSASDVAQDATLFIRRLLVMARNGLSGPAERSEPDAATKTLFEHIGRVQCRSGQHLTKLLTAYQVGARVAWRHVAATALEQGLEPNVLAALAEAVFVFVNELSSSTANGYVLEQAESSIARERLREELATLLLSDRSDRQAIQSAAARAGWALPSEAAVVLVDPADEAAWYALDRLEPYGLPVRQPDLYGAIVPDPAGPGRAEQLRRSLRGAGAVVGHSVPLELLPATARVAQIALDLKRDGCLHGDPILASEHLDTIIVQRDQRLIGVLRDQALRPADDLSDTARDRLLTTLTSWLRHMGDRQAVAAELHVHPQTVRYRLAQLRDCFGTDLDDPRARARLELALLWQPSDT